MKKLIAIFLTAGAMMMAEGIPTARAQTSPPTPQTQSLPAADAP
jgi:hypothetical protein